MHKNVPSGLGRGKGFASDNIFLRQEEIVHVVGARSCGLDASMLAG